MTTPTPEYSLPKWMEYQRRWLLDFSMIKIWEKSRRIGATYVQSFEDVQDILKKTEYTPGRPVRRVYFSSADESAAREYIGYCADWAKLYNALLKSGYGVEAIDEERGINALVLEVKNGGKIYAMTSNPKRFRSKGGKIVLDEFAHHGDQMEMWKAAKPSAMWGYPIRILSTHNGKQCLYYRFVEDARKGQSGWKLHTVSITDAMSDGLVDKIYGRPTTTEEKTAWLFQQRRDCRSEDIWNEEYMCIPVDSATAFLPYETIEAVMRNDVLYSWEQLVAAKNALLYMGYDVARSGHKSIFWIDELLGDVLYTRYVKEFEKTRFAVQMDFFDKAMQLPGMRRCCIDNTGMGMPLAEQASERYGTFRVEGINFTAQMKEELAQDLKNGIEDFRDRLPSDEVIRESFHSIRRIPSGNIARYDADATEATGHADHFWAKALARHAAKSNAGPLSEELVSGKRPETNDIENVYQEADMRHMTRIYRTFN